MTLTVICLFREARVATVLPFPATIMRKILWLPLLTTMLAGCGLKGPLYLPEQKPGAKPAAAAPASAPADKKAADPK